VVAERSSVEEEAQVGIPQQQDMQLPQDQLLRSQ